MISWPRLTWESVFTSPGMLWRFAPVVRIGLAASTLACASRPRAASTSALAAFNSALACLARSIAASRVSMPAARTATADPIVTLTMTPIARRM